MVQATIGSAQLAREVLEFLNVNDIAGAKSLLVEVIGSDVEAADRTFPSLGASATYCMIGIEPSASVMFHAPLYRARLWDEDSHRGSRGNPRHALEERATWWSALTAPAIQALFETHSPDLERAQEWMRQCSSVGRWPHSVLVPFTPDMADRVQADVDGSRSPQDGEIKSFISELLLIQMAQRSTSDRIAKRLIYCAKEIGMNQREIAGIVRRPQTAIFRELRALEDEPSLMAFSPREIFDHYQARHIDRPRMIALLAAYPYEPGELSSEAPDWAYLPGSWDQLSELAIDGSITQEELEAIVAHAEQIGADGV